MTDPSIADPFDDLMAANDPSVVIVTTIADGRRAGCLVGFHSQCSIEPLRYAIWLSKANHTFGVAFAADTFAIHWIRADRSDLADLFGGTTGDEIDKFTRCAWTEGPGGVPLLDECEDRFVGRRLAWLDVDVDHCCIVLEPLAAHRRPDGAGPPSPLRVSDAADIDAGHASSE